MNEQQMQVVALDPTELSSIEGGGWAGDVGWMMGYAVRDAWMYYHGEFDALSAPPG